MGAYVDDADYDLTNEEVRVMFTPDYDEVDGTTGICSIRRKNIWI